VKEAIRTGTERGMVSFDASLYNLVREGKIELEEALSAADSRANLEAKINFG
jgi:twitching motility protein PilU